MARLDHLWQSELFSDVTIVVKAPAEGDSGDATPLQVIQRLPGHRAPLSGSPVLRAQLERWQQQVGPSSKHSDTPPSSPNAQTDAQQQLDQQPDQQQPEATLILDSEEQEPAAMAVLAYLYGVSTNPEQLTDLQHLHMLIVADMLQVSAVAEAAVKALVSIAADPAKGLSDDAKQQLRSMKAWPPCLVDALPSLTQQLPLLDAAGIWAKAAAPSSPSSLGAVQAAPHSRYMRGRLLQELGDLEKVWRNSEKQKQLLGLPLAAMQLLLGSRKLKVATEDTVLFTAQEYANCGAHLSLRKAVQEQLAQLIRCPYLSPFWLTAAVRATEAQLLLAAMKDQLLELLAVLQVWPAFKTTEGAANELEKLVPNAPSSWLLGPRQLVAPPGSVHVSWELPVSQLNDWCLGAAATTKLVSIDSPNCTAPLRGMTFKILLQCDFKPEPGAGVRVGFFVCPKLAVTNMFVSYSAVITAAGKTYNFDSSPTKSNSGWGSQDYFSLGPMRDGWDAAAWAREQLPTEGNLVILDTVS